MQVIDTPLAGLKIIQPTVYPDSRGYFFESYSQTKWLRHNLEYKWLQDNQALSTYGVIRGLHFQKEPHAQAKLVQCIVGSILDLVVDIRKNSETYGQQFGIELNDQNKKQLLVPKGFAHGYAVLSEVSIVTYKVDAYYNKESEGGIHPFCPHLNINWQVPVLENALSDKDKILPLFSEF
jgi:dTDP-4-dehydrorhamnose 3,5-epimerase